MTKLFRLLQIAIILTFMAGCSSNYFNVPRETFEKKVRVLGIAPLMVDPESDIRHPERGEVLRLIRDGNRKNEKELVEILKESGEYFSVRLLDEEAAQLFATTVTRRERRDDAGIVYNKFFYKPEELKKLVTRHNVDAVMLVTVSGVTMFEKIYSNNFMAYLEDNYNNLIMTAQIFDGDGTMLWEYPNFRQKILTYPDMLGLQYPDFEEAKANLTDQVRLKYKSIPGLARAFTQTERASFSRSKEVSIVYNKQFGAMASLLQYFRNPFEERKEEKKPKGATGSTGAAETAVPAVPLAAPATVQPAAAPLTQPVPAAAKPVSAAPAPAPQPAEPSVRQFEPAPPLPPKSAEPPLPSPGIIREEVIK